jgi:hypothetical protein
LQRGIGRHNGARAEGLKLGCAAASVRDDDRFACLEVQVKGIEHRLQPHDTAEL